MVLIDWFRYYRFAVYACFHASWWILIFLKIRIVNTLEVRLRILTSKMVLSGANPAVTVVISNISLNGSRNSTFVLLEIAVASARWFDWLLNWSFLFFPQVLKLYPLFYVGLFVSQCKGFFEKVVVFDYIWNESNYLLCAILRGNKPLEL